MIVYFDTSSLLKLYLQEPGREAVIQLATAADGAATCIIAYAEARAGLARAWSNHRIAKRAYSIAKGAFEDEWPRYLVRDVTEPLSHLAGDLAETHLLRGFDAIHLASAITLQRELAEPITFSAFDDHLNDSAAAEGLLLP